jgi:sigma-B regulation protein RsbU (phosphoserine phosphatase)
MEAHDVSQNAMIARLAKLTEDLQQSRSPDQTVAALRRGFAAEDEVIASLLLATRGLRPGEYRIVRMQSTDHPQDDHPGQEPAPVCSGGVVPAILARSRAQLVQDVEWSDDPFFHSSLRGYWSVIAVPVSGKRLPMDWVLLLRKAPRRFTLSDVEDALERVALGGALLENQMLAADLARANERIDHEARQVGELQRALLPASVPQIAGLEIATSYEPSGRAGGDLYDFFPLHHQPRDAGAAPGRWCMLTGDAAGHGLAAAVVTAIVQAVLHAHPPGIAGPADLLTHANRHLCSKRIGGFFTAFLGVYEPESRRLTYANAGHPAPLLRRASDQSIGALDAALNYPLGIDETESFEEAAIGLDEGDALLLYTDGVTDACDAAGNPFSLDQLRRAFGDGGDGPVEVIDRLRAAVRAHRHTEPAPDDQTLVAARVL